MQHILSGWRRNFGNWVLGGGNLALIFIGFQRDTQAAWLLAFTLIALTSLWAWHGNLKRYRTIADTPTSRIVSASQGYIEVVGRGKAASGIPPLHPLNHLPCLWHRYLIEEPANNRWTKVQEGASKESFVIDDGSGSIQIDPYGAEILCSRKEVSSQFNRRTTCWTLLEGDTIYVLGEYVSSSRNADVSTRSRKVSDRLSEWKRDQSDLLSRFDSNADGAIDLQEWSAVRLAAETEVGVLATTSSNLKYMRLPQDGRPFLIADKNVTELAQHYRRWSIVHLVALALAAYGVVHFA